MKEFREVPTTNLEISIGTILPVMSLATYMVSKKDSRSRPLDIIQWRQWACKAIGCIAISWGIKMNFSLCMNMAGFYWGSYICTQYVRTCNLPSAILFTPSTYTLKQNGDGLSNIKSIFKTPADSSIVCFVSVTVTLMARNMKHIYTHT